MATGTGTSTFFETAETEHKPKLFQDAYLFQICSAVDPDPHYVDFLLDPDPYCECGYGSESRSKEIDQNLKINLTFSLVAGSLLVCQYYYLEYLNN
jgi:hypothetical protein